MTASIAVDEALLALKIAFLVLLYLFIWMVARSATRDVKAAPQESIVLSAAEANELRAQFGASTVRPAKLVVVSSPALPTGRHVDVTEPLVIGRAPTSGLRLDHDDFVSSSHAKITPTQNGTWVEDLGSTNGTFVNGAAVTSARLLQRGDVVRIGDTQLRLDS